MDTQNSQSTRLLRQLFSHNKRLFTIEDAKEAAEQGHIPLNRIKNILFSLVKRRHLLRIRRGLYLGLGLLPEETQIHPFVIATHLIQPAAISHWSALEYHGLTEQVPQVITASTPKKVLTPSMRDKNMVPSAKKHAWEIAGVRYEYVTVQKKHYFGFEKIWIDEHFQIEITDRERTLLDLFTYPKMFGGMGEALGILESALSKIDIEKLINYAVRYNKKSVIKRLGWSLEYFQVKQTKLQSLLKIPMNYYCRLDPQAPAIGHCDKRWMIQNNLVK